MQPNDPSLQETPNESTSAQPAVPELKLASSDRVIQPTAGFNPSKTTSVPPSAPPTTTTPVTPVATSPVVLPTPDSRKRMLKVGVRVLLFLILMAWIVVAALAFRGFHSSVNKQSLQAATSKTGWKTFKSAASSIQFMYPASWKLTNSAKIPSTPSWFLEGVYLQAPNNFIMYLGVAKAHTIPLNSNCGPYYAAKPTKLNSQYDLVMEGQSSKRIYDVTLVSQSNTAALNRGSIGCTIYTYYPNSLGSDESYAFSGQYEEQGNLGYQEPSESSFMAQPEVIIAKAIFSSFKP